MTNVTYIYFENFENGCELEISVSETETGPYIPGIKSEWNEKLTRMVAVRKKFFPRSSLRRVKVGSLPCKFLKIVVHKGVTIDTKSIHLFGFYAEDTEEIFGDGLFEVLVTNSTRLIYSWSWKENIFIVMY